VRGHFSIGAPHAAGPDRSLLDPGANQFDFSVFQAPAKGHPLQTILPGDAKVEAARLRVACPHERSGHSISQGQFPGIEAQPGLLLLGAMAGVAGSLEDRINLGCEVHGADGLLPRCWRRKGNRKRPGQDNKEQTRSKAHAENYSKKGEIDRVSSRRPRWNPRRLRTHSRLV
jgi:hypothetical protein